MLYQNKKYMSAKGGITEGKSHAEGGIPMVVKSTGQQVELEGGEGVINKRNMASTKTFDFEGKKMTICEIASKINSADGNGVQIDCDNVTGTKYKYAKGGNILSEDDEQSFKEWIEDGNVIEFEKDVYSTQDAQYRNRLKGMDELRKYFRKEFLSDSYSQGGDIKQELKMDYNFSKLLFPNERQFFLLNDTKIIQHRGMIIVTDGKREIIFNATNPISKLKKLGNASKSTKELYNKYFAEGGYVDLETYDYNDLIGKYVNIYSMGVELPTEHRIEGVMFSSPQFRYRYLTLKFDLGIAPIKIEDIEDFLNNDIVYVKDGKEEFGIQYIPNQFAKGGRTKNAMKTDDYENASVSMDSYEDGAISSNPTEFADGGGVDDLKKKKITIQLDSLTDSTYFNSSYNTFRYGYNDVDIVVNMVNKEYGYAKMKGKYAVINIEGEYIEGRSMNKNIFNTKEEAISYIKNKLTDEDNKFAGGGGVGNVNTWNKGDVTIVNGDYKKRAEVVPSYKDDRMLGNYFVVFRNSQGKIINTKDNFENYSDALEYAKQNVNKIQFAKGGEVDLPKANKMFHLPLELAVYVPSTQDVDKVISESELKERVSEVSEYLARLFGGFTKSDKIGGFMSSKSELVTEDVVPVVSFATQSDFNANKNKLVNKLSEWAKRWGQEAIGFEFEGDLYYVPQSFANGGGIKKIKYEDMTKQKHAEGGEVDGKKYYMLFNTSEFKGQPMYNYIANSKQEVIDILNESYGDITKRNEIYSLKDMDESEYDSYIDDDYAFVTANPKRFDYAIHKSKSVEWQKVDGKMRFYEGWADINYFDEEGEYRKYHTSNHIKAESKEKAKMIFLRFIENAIGKNEWEWEDEEIYIQIAQSSDEFIEFKGYLSADNFGGLTKDKFSEGRFAKGGEVDNEKVFEAQEDGIIGIASGSDAYTMEISKGDKFVTHGNQDNKYWWIVKMVDKTPRVMQQVNKFDYNENKSRVNVNTSDLILTFPRGDKSIYAEMKEVYAKGGGVRELTNGKKNQMYLENLPFEMHKKYLENIAKHYGVTLEQIKREVYDDDAEMLYEYITDKNARAIVYRDMQSMQDKFAGGGDVRDFSWYQDFKKQELKRGTEHEMEHIESIKKFKKKGVSDREVAKAIAKDHLDENENYYIELEKMQESSAKVSNALQDFAHQKSKRKSSRKYNLGGLLGNDKPVNVHVFLVEDYEAVVRSKDGTYVNDVNLKKDKVYKFGFLFDEGKNVGFDLGDGSNNYILVPSILVVVVGYDENKMELGGEVKSYADYNLDRNDKSILKLLLNINPYSATAEQRDKISTFKGNNVVNDLSPKLIQKIYGILFQNHNVDNKIKNLYITNIGVGNILMYAPSYLEKTMVGFDEKNEFVQVEKEIANIVTEGKRAFVFNEFELTDMDAFIHVYPKVNPKNDDLCSIFYKSKKKAVAVGVCEFTSKQKLEEFQRSIVVNQGSMSLSQMISFAKSNDYLVVNEGITSEGDYTLIYTMTKY